MKNILACTEEIATNVKWYTSYGNLIATFKSIYILYVTENIKIMYKNLNMQLQLYLWNQKNYSIATKKKSTHRKKFSVHELINWLQNATLFILAMTNKRKQFPNVARCMKQWKAAKYAYLIFSKTVFFFFKLLWLCN